MRKLLYLLCTWVAAIATIAPNACRSNWYEPEEPEGLEEFFHRQ